MKGSHRNNIYALSKERHNMRSRIYHQNNHSLIFQFILSEFIAIYHLFKEWDEKLEEENCHALKQFFLKLIGPQGNLLTNSSAEGLLIKMQTSCQHLATDNGDSKLIPKLCSYIQKIIRLCRQEWKIVELKSTPTLISIHEFKCKVQKYLKKMSRLIAKLILQFAEDESMLLFLLQNHQQLNNVFHIQFVSRLFSKIFQNGIKEAEKYMVKQYCCRGYQTLVPYISEKVKDLQNTDLMVKESCTISQHVYQTIN